MVAGPVGMATVECTLRQGWVCTLRTAEAPRCTPGADTVNPYTLFSRESSTVPLPSVPRSLSSSPLRTSSVMVWKVSQALLPSWQVLVPAGHRKVLPT